VKPGIPRLELIHRASSKIVVRLNVDRLLQTNLQPTKAAKKNRVDGQDRARPTGESDRQAIQEARGVRMGLPLRAGLLIGYRHPSKHGLSVTWLLPKSRTVLEWMRGDGVAVASLL
jgi:hypothetical protein